MKKNLLLPQIDKHNTDNDFAKTDQTISTNIFKKFNCKSQYLSYAQTKDVGSSKNRVNKSNKIKSTRKRRLIEYIMILLTYRDENRRKQVFISNSCNEIMLNGDRTFKKQHEYLLFFLLMTFETNMKIFHQMTGQPPCD